MADAQNPGPVRSVQPGQRQTQLHNINLARLGECVASDARSSDSVRHVVAQQPRPESATSGTSNLTGGPTTQSSCQCLTSALSLLETLTIQSAQPSARTVARILHFKKRALAQCDVLLDCQRCGSLSSFIMLLVVFCEKMVTSYERVLVILTAQYKARQGQQSSDIAGGGFASAASERDEERRMAVRDYDVDMEEQPCVFGSLASMQMRKMKTFLARVKTVLRQWNCELHVATVVSVEERLRQQLRLFDKDSNEH